MKNETINEKLDAGKSMIHGVPGSTAKVLLNIRATRNLFKGKLTIHKVFKVFGK